jgi:hypothetical protein
LATAGDFLNELRPAASPHGAPRLQQEVVPMRKPAPGISEGIIERFQEIDSPDLA